MRHWRAQKLLHCNAVAAHQQLPLRLECGNERGQSRQRVACSAGLDLDGGEVASLVRKKVHLAIAIAPVEQFAIAAGSSVGKADRMAPASAGPRFLAME